MHDYRNQSHKQLKERQTAGKKIPRNTGTVFFKICKETGEVEKLTGEKKTGQWARSLTWKVLKRLEVLRLH